MANLNNNPNTNNNSTERKSTNTLNPQRNSLTKNTLTPAKVNINSLQNQNNNLVNNSSKTLQEESNVITTIGKENPLTKKKLPLWVKPVIFIVVGVIFLSACLFATFAIISLVRKNNANLTTMKVDFVTSGDVSYTIKERIIKNEGTDNEQITVKDLDADNIEYKWSNGNKATFEIQIEFNQAHQFRFRQYNLYFDNYVSDSLFTVDFISDTSNFNSKFVLKDDGYYYFKKSSQPSTKLTLICSIEFNIPNYRDQFNGVEITEVFSFQSSLNPYVDWGYYSYMFE